MTFTGSRGPAGSVLVLVARPLADDLGLGAPRPRHPRLASSSSTSSIAARGAETRQTVRSGSIGRPRRPRRARGPRRGGSRRGPAPLTSTSMASGISEGMQRTGSSWMICSRTPPCCFTPTGMPTRCDRDLDVHRDAPLDAQEVDVDELVLKGWRLDLADQRLVALLLALDLQLDDRVLHGDRLEEVLRLMRVHREAHRVHVLAVEDRGHAPVLPQLARHALAGASRSRASSRLHGLAS